MGCWGRVGSDMDRRDWTAQCNIHKYRYHTYNWTGLKSPSGQLVVWGPVVWNSIGFPYERDYYLGVPRSNPNIPAHQSANCNPKLCLKMAQIWKPSWRLFCQGVTHQTSQVQSCWTRTPPQKHTHTHNKPKPCQATPLRGQPCLANTDRALRAVCPDLWKADARGAGNELSEQFLPWKGDF